jgi:hypothetical protein
MAGTPPHLPVHRTFLPLVNLILALSHTLCSFYLILPVYPLEQSGTPFRPCFLL